MHKKIIFSIALLISFWAMVNFKLVNFPDALFGDEIEYFKFTSEAVSSGYLDFRIVGQQGHSTFTIPFHLLTRSPWSIRYATALALFLTLFVLLRIAVLLADNKSPTLYELLLLPLLFLFMPYLYVSPWQGYIDGIQVFYMCAMLYFYFRKNLWGTSFWFGLAMGVKPFTLCFWPILLELVLGKKIYDKDKKAKSFLVFIATLTLAFGPFFFFGISSYLQTGHFFNNNPTIPIDPHLGSINLAYFKSNVGRFIDFFVFDTDANLKIHLHPTILVMSYLAMLYQGLVRKETFALLCALCIACNVFNLSVAGFWIDRYFLSSYVLTLFFLFIYYRHQLMVISFVTLLQATFFSRINKFQPLNSEWGSISNLGGHKSYFVLLFVTLLVLMFSKVYNKRGQIPPSMTQVK